MKRQVAVLRDVAVSLVGVAVVTTCIRSHSWTPLALAVIASAAWIASARIEVLPEDVISQAATVGLGLLIAWRVADAWLPVHLAGMWLLVCAIDLQRLHLRFPDASPPLRQRLAVRRHLVHLAVLGAATGVVAALARVVVVPLRLTAIALVATFVIVVITQFTRRLTEPPASGQE